MEKLAATTVPQVIPDCVPCQEPPSCLIGTQYSAPRDLSPNMVIGGFEEMMQFIGSYQFDDTLAIGRILLWDQEDLIHKALRRMLREEEKRPLPMRRSFSWTEVDGFYFFLPVPRA